jgi:hypothetical protein
VSDHGKNAKEFALLVKAGMTPGAAIRAATIDAATLLDRAARTGSIEPGKDADIIAVATSPLEDVTGARTRALRHAPGRGTRAGRGPAAVPAALAPRARARCARRFSRDEWRDQPIALPIAATGFLLFGTTSRHPVPRYPTPTSIASIGA